MKTLQTIAAGVLVLGMGSAFAGEPVALNETQMDKVSAGYAAAASDANASAFIGTVTAGTTASATHQTSNFWFFNNHVDTASSSGYATASGIDVRATSASASVAY